MRYGFDAGGRPGAVGGAPAVHRQADEDAGALVGLARDRDRSAVEADEAAHDGKAEPGSLIGPVERSLRLEEGAADAGEILRMNADAGIARRPASAICLRPRRGSKPRRRPG